MNTAVFIVFTVIYLSSVILCFYNMEKYYKTGDGVGIDRSFWDFFICSFPIVNTFVMIVLIIRGILEHKERNEVQERRMPPPPPGRMMKNRDDNSDGWIPTNNENKESIDAKESVGIKFNFK